MMVNTTEEKKEWKGDSIMEVDVKNWKLEQNSKGTPCKEGNFEWRQKDTWEKMLQAGCSASPKFGACIVFLRNIKETRPVYARGTVRLDEAGKVKQKGRGLWTLVFGLPCGCFWPVQNEQQWYCFFEEHMWVSPCFFPSEL